MGLYTGTEFAYDRMDAKGKGGHIINIASIAGSTGKKVFLQLEKRSFQ